MSSEVVFRTVFTRAKHIIDLSLSFKLALACFHDTIPPP